MVEIPLRHSDPILSHQCIINKLLISFFQHVSFCSVLNFKFNFNLDEKISIGGSKGGTRDACPRGPNSFIFMQFSAKM